jgi:transcriptional regulator with XRE-family HTH domain
MAAGREEQVVRARRLRIELRQLRRDQAQTQADVARAMDWSNSKVIRIESGDARITVSDLRALLAHYGVGDAERIERLVEMARQSRNDPWKDFKDVHQAASLKYFGFEASASLVRAFSPALIHGLLQTEEYARALAADTFEWDERETERRWEARQRRQELHERPSSPEMFFVLDEAVIRREVGGAGVMRRQLERLQELARSGHLSLRVIPFTRGAHLGLTGPFVILEFPNPDDDDVLYLENVMGEVTREETEVTAKYTDRFFKLEAAALSESETSKLIDAAIEDMSGPAPDRRRSAATPP